SKESPNLMRFARNAPVIYVDRNGLTIRFSPEAPGPFVDHWRDCICKLMTSPNGREILRQAAQPNIDIIIEPSHDETATGARTIQLNSDDPVGTSPEQRAELEGFGEMLPTSLAGCATVLAHELGHALHLDDNDPLGEDYDVKSPSWGRNVQTHENPVRA